jgi:hypothetical protein
MNLSWLFGAWKNKAESKIEARMTTSVVPAAPASQSRAVSGKTPKAPQFMVRFDPQTLLKIDEKEG